MSSCHLYLAPNMAEIIEENMIMCIRHSAISIGRAGARSEAGAGRHRLPHHARRGKPEVQAPQDTGEWLCGHVEFPCNQMVNILMHMGDPLNLRNPLFDGITLA